MRIGGGGWRLALGMTSGDGTRERNISRIYTPLFCLSGVALDVTFDFSTANDISPLSSALLADNLSTRPALFPLELEPLQHIDNSGSLSFNLLYIISFQHV